MAKYNTETAVQRGCIKAFESADWFVLRLNQASVPGRRFSGMTGASDVICFVPRGRVVCVEFKRDEAAYGKWKAQDNPSVKSHRHALEQKAFAREVRKRQSMYKVVCSIDQAIQLIGDLS